MTDGDLRARLRRLRREEPERERGAPTPDGGELESEPDEAVDDSLAVGGSPDLVVPTGPTERGELPTWLRTRLGRVERTPPAAVTVDAPAQLEPVPLDGQPSRAVARITRFGADHQHGAWRLDAVHASSVECLALVAADPDVARLDTHRAVFLDIETTGLSGGAGTYPYLVALGSFAADGHFELWQGFMREPDEERDMLQAVADRVAAAGQLVTFFGKSFDRHRLEDKMRMHGVAAPFEAALHLDLYHPCRRLYREGFVDGRLQTMERGLCGFERVDDLPGAMAPAAWFDFVAGRPHRLEQVFDHNRDDVLSLVTLTAHLGRASDERDPQGDELSGCPLGRARGLAKLFGSRGDRAAELLWVERALERLDGVNGDRTDARRQHLLWRAVVAERLGDRDRALRELLELAQGRPDAVATRAWARAAKLLEHHARDLDAAAGACDRVLALAEGTLFGRERASLEAEARKRRGRLDRRRQDR